MLFYYNAVQKVWNVENIKLCFVPACQLSFGCLVLNMPRNLKLHVVVCKITSSMLILDV